MSKLKKYYIFISMLTGTINNSLYGYVKRTTITVALLLGLFFISGHIKKVRHVHESTSVHQIELCIKSAPKLQCGQEWPQFQVKHHILINAQLSVYPKPILFTRYIGHQSRTQVQRALNIKPSLAFQVKHLQYAAGLS
ncbi:hypothetical protein A0256_05845 [Mucilaginibacter sp. PAMC 26640]|nr:hypothetical protein A0256_05845 [Mucilaginibacter sp. PAMC 26640]